MSLRTYVYLLDSIDPAAVFAKMQKIIGPRPDGQPTVTCTGVEPPEYGGYLTLGNEGGQWLDARLRCMYRAGAPLATADGNAAALAEHLQSAEHAECDGDCSDWKLDTLLHPCWMSVDFDTTYGYDDAQGRDCNALHVAYIRELGPWLEAQGVRWEWRNEYTGEVNTGYTGLEKFMHNGDQAQGWFYDQALPAIAKMMQTGEPQ